VILFLKDYLSLKVGKKAAESIIAEAGCPVEVNPMAWYPAELAHNAFDFYIYEFGGGEMDEARKLGQYFFYKYAEAKPWEFFYVKDPVDEDFLKRFWYSFYRGPVEIRRFEGGALMEVHSEDFGMAPTYALVGWIEAMAEHMGVRLAAVALRERLVEFIVSW